MAYNYLRKLYVRKERGQRLMKPAVLLCCLMTMTSHLAVAQSDPPSRVARLSYMEGTVSFQPGSVDEWVAAEINRPITTGDGLWVDDGSRAEVHIGAARLRLSRQTGVSFLNLDESTVQIQLDRGTLRIDLQELGEGETFEVDTPNVAFALRRGGEYRFEVNEPGDLTRITVRAGEGEASGGGQTVAVSAGQQVRYSGTDTVSSVFEAPGPPDDFDRWCAARETREQRAESAKYVSRETVGYEDLDDHGTWRTDAEYGPVWSPRGVAADWAPYRDGRWVWMDPWGWTWVDYAPWGFAPFHYGRWVFASRGWGWVPGPMVRRPVYAPALVVWVGGSSFGTGVAWFPLGPREAYVPVYRTSPLYMRRINVTTVNVTNINVTRINYVNRGHVTVVSREAFVGARPVARSMVHVPPDAMAHGRVTNAVRIAPQRASVLGRDALSPGVAHPPAALLSRPVVARTTPPPRRVPFSQQERLLARSPGRPLGPSELSRIQPAGATHPNVRPADSRSSGRIGARPADAGRSRPGADTKAEQRRSRQEQQRQQKQQQQEQKRQRELQRKEQRTQQQARPSRQQRTYPTRQQQAQPNQTQRAKPSRQQQQTQPSQTQQAQPSRQQQQAQPSQTQQAKPSRKQTEKKSPPPKKQPEPPKNQ